MVIVPRPNSSWEANNVAKRLASYVATRMLMISNAKLSYMYFDIAGYVAVYHFTYTHANIMAVNQFLL